MPAEQIVLDINGIDKRFGGVHALKKVSFNIRKGEVHAVVGENGAGKSTLMKILAGTYQPDNGEFLMRGKSVQFNNPFESHAAGINIIYQEFFSFPALDVIANVFAGKELSKLGILDEKEMRKRACDVFSRMGIEIDIDEIVGNLSVASQQVIEIAKALVYKGSVVIMDEPNSALTDRETQALFGIIKRLKEQGITIVYVSHRLEEVFRISDRITVLRDGRYLGTWVTRKTNISFIISKMIGRTLEETFPKLLKVKETTPPVLEVKNLARKDLVEDVSFYVKPGEILGFAGLEGSGIRTLFHILFGINHADSGDIIYRGKTQNITFSSKAIKIGWGLIPANRRDHGLIMRWPVDENIALVVLKKLLNFFGLINAKKIENTAISYIKKLKIATDTVDKIVFDLSGGNQQKVVVAKWLATEPKLLFLDDPTRGIDVGAKAEVYALINELAKQGIAILFNSSEIDEVIGLSHRLLVMRQGRIIREFSHRDAEKAEVLRYVSGDINHKENMKPKKT